MRNRDKAAEIDAAARRAYDQLIGESLPAAGRARGWPWTTREEFEALLRGHVREGDASSADDALAQLLELELGARLLTGEICWTRLRACEVARAAGAQDRATPPPCALPGADSTVPEFPANIPDRTFSRRARR